MLVETEKLEFKEIATNEIYKEIIAFANTDGGRLLIGINDRGELTPLVNVDDVYTRVTNGIRDTIAPDVTMFTTYQLEENHTIQIDVAEGQNKPYYLKAKGLKPSGVYVRQGTSSVQASFEQIRQLIKESDGDTFESLRSLNQDLSFEQCERIFKKHELAFDQEKFNILGIKNHNSGLYTNLGLLFADQCQHTIKIAVFDDVENTIFKDRQEFFGSLLQQVEDAFKYIQLNNKTRSVIDDLVRKDYWDYPKEALREALINAVMHRDYSYSGSIIVNINRAFIEFISIGGLLPGMSREDILLGVSQLRNQKLTEVFLRLNIIEAYGTGIKRIFNLYKGSKQLPQIDVGPNSFRIRIPNRNEMV
ncbi:MAG: putative DNA binding domain-containing protein [Defluviitaleaceae bacterium]|nr:putative DNA binding domain-containing protein [Defluviitaleaceae bacterium]